MSHLIRASQVMIRTIGWKKKNKEPMLASISSNPLFQRKKAPAVDMTPKYNTPSITYVFTVPIEATCSSHIIKGVIKRVKRIWRTL